MPGRCPPCANPRRRARDPRAIRRTARAQARPQPRNAALPVQPSPDLARALKKHARLIPDPSGFLPLDGGRTNRVWRFHAAGRDLVLKLYRRGDGNPLFTNDPGREAACLRALAGSGLAPEPVASGKAGDADWIVYAHCPGIPWTTGPQIAARLLSRLHREPPVPGLPADPGGSAALARRTRAILELCPAPARNDLAARAPSVTVPPAERLSLIHGDPVPGNILVGNGQAVLIDWQCPALGDPSEDIALFLSPAMQMLYRGSPLSESESAAFLAANEDRDAVARYKALRPWFHWRMAAYCLWQTGRGAADYEAGLVLELYALSALVAAT